MQYHYYTITPTSIYTPLLLTPIYTITIITQNPLRNDEPFVFLETREIYLSSDIGFSKLKIMR